MLTEDTPDNRALLGEQGACEGAAYINLFRLHAVVHSFFLKKYCRVSTHNRIHADAMVVCVYSTDAMYYFVNCLVCWNIMFSDCIPFARCMFLCCF